MKKLVLMLSLCALLFACNNQMVRIAEDDAEDLTAYKKWLAEYSLCGDYKVDDSEIENELKELVSLNLAGVDIDASETESEEDVLASVKSSATPTFKINKVGNYKSMAMDNLDSPIYQTKSASGLSFDIDYVNINEWNIEYDDGRFSRVLTSDDRRIGTVLFVSDPISKDTSLSKEESTDYGKEFVDEIIDEYVLNTKEILSSITQEEIDEVRQDIEQSQAASATKSKFWETEDWSKPKFHSYQSAKIKTQWGFDVDYEKSFGYSINWYVNHQVPYGRCYPITLAQKTGSVAIAQVANYFKKWNPRWKDAFSYEANGWNVPDFIVSVFASLTCRGTAETARADYTVLGYHATTGTTIACSMRRHGYTVYHKAKPISVAFSNDGVSMDYIFLDMDKYKTPSIGVFMNKWSSNGWRIKRIAIFDGEKTSYQKRDKWRFWVKSTDYKWDTKLHVNLCEGPTDCDGWYDSLAIAGSRCVSELICHIR